MANHTIFVCGKCFEPRGISYLFSVTIWVRVVFRKIICLHRPVSIFWIFNVGTGNIFFTLFAGWHLDQQVHVRPCAGFPVKFPLEETEFSKQFTLLLHHSAIHCQQKICPQGVAVVSRTFSRHKEHFSLAELIPSPLDVSPGLSSLLLLLDRLNS